MAIYKIDEVCELIKGNTPIQKAISGEYPLVVTAEDRLTNENYQFDCKAVCIPLVSSTGHGHASIKRIHYQEGKFALGNILIAAIPKNKNVLKAEYLYVYLSYMKDLILVPLMKGSANVSLTIKALKSAEIEVPSLEVQESIIKLSKDMKIDRETLNNALEMQLNDIVKLRQSILKEAIKGKLALQDPNDELASVLLDKIKEEKERLMKEGKIYKKKSLDNFSQKDIPFNIPHSWVWCYLSDVSVIQEGAGIRKYQYKSEGIQLFSVTNVLQGNIDLQKKQLFVSAEEYQSKYTHLTLNKGDIVTACSGGSWGKTAIYDKSDIVMLNTSTLRMRFFSDLANNEYLYYLTKSFCFKNQIERQLVGMQPNFGYAHYSKVLIPLPPLKEQFRIVQKVNELFAFIDELEKNIEQSKMQSELLMQSVLQKAFKDNGEKNDEISFGEFIKQKRKDKDITITDMLKLLKDVKSSEYTMIEEGFMKPEKLIIEKIAKALKLSETEMKLFKNLKIKVNMNDCSDSNYDFKIAARRINKN